MSSVSFSTRQQRIACARLPDPHLTRLARLFHIAHHGHVTVPAACGGLKPPPAGRLRRADNPSSPAQHRISKLSLHRAPFHVRDAPYGKTAWPPPRCDATAQDVEHVAVLVDRAPQVMGGAVDLHEHLVEVPFVAGAGSPPTSLGRVVRPELGTPGPDRLVGDHHAAGEHQLLNVAQAQRETVIQPHRVPDDLDRIPVALVPRRNRHKRPILAAPHQVNNLTMPAEAKLRRWRVVVQSGADRGLLLLGPSDTPLSAYHP